MIQSILNVSEATALQTADKLAKGEAQDGAVQKNQVNFISSLPAYTYGWKVTSVWSMHYLKNDKIHLPIIILSAEEI